MHSAGVTTHTWRRHASRRRRDRPPRVGPGALAAHAPYALVSCMACHRSAPRPVRGPWATKTHMARQATSRCRCPCRGVGIRPRRCRPTPGRNGRQVGVGQPGGALGRTPTERDERPRPLHGLRGHLDRAAVVDEGLPRDGLQEDLDVVGEDLAADGRSRRRTSRTPTARTRRPSVSSRRPPLMTSTTMASSAAATGWRSVSTNAETMIRAWWCEPPRRRPSPTETGDSRRLHRGARIAPPVDIRGRPPRHTSR